MTLRNLHRQALRIGLLTVLALSSGICCMAQQNPGQNLFLIKEGNRYGYIDSQGKVVIKLPPECGVAYPFSEGLAEVCIGGKCGYINPEGNFVIAPQFTESNPFSEGLAWARVENDEGMINAKGEFVIKPKKYRIVSPF